MQCCVPVPVKFKVTQVTQKLGQTSKIWFDQM